MLAGSGATTTKQVFSASLCGLFCQPVVRQLVPAPMAARAARSGVAAGRAIQRVAFLGAGDISNLHAAAVRRSPRAELVGMWNRAGCSIVPDPQAKADEYGCYLYPSTEALVHDPNVDAVFILTNMESHCEFAELAMAAGKPVYVEKPVASSLPELRRMHAAAERHGVVCMPGHNYIYEPAVQRIKQMIDSDALGNVCSLEVHYNIHHPPAVCERLPGVVRQILTHHAYTTLYLLGRPPLELTAMGSVINDGTLTDRENVAMVVMRHPSNGDDWAGAGPPPPLLHNAPLSLLQASFAADDHSSDPWSFHIKVLGTKGSARYSYNDFVVHAPHLVHSHTYAAYPYTVEAASAHFLHEVLGEGRAPLSTLDDAVTCQKIIEAAERSMAERRHVALSEFA